MQQGQRYRGRLEWPSLLLHRAITQNLHGKQRYGTISAVLVAPTISTRRKTSWPPASWGGRNFLLEGYGGGEEEVSPPSLAQLQPSIQIRARGKADNIVYNVEIQAPVFEARFPNPELSRNFPANLVLNIKTLALHCGISSWKEGPGLFSYELMCWIYSFAGSDIDRENFANPGLAWSGCEKPSTGWHSFFGRNIQEFLRAIYLIQYPKNVKIFRIAQIKTRFSNCDPMRLKLLTDIQDLSTLTWYTDTVLTFIDDDEPDRYFSFDVVLQTGASSVNYKG